jgi:hypothetical protein
MSTTDQNNVDIMLYLYNVKYDTNSLPKPGIFTKELADAFIKEKNLKDIFEEIKGYRLDKTKLRDIFDMIITKKSKGIVTTKNIKTTNSNSDIREITFKNPTGRLSLFTPKKSFQIKKSYIDQINRDHFDIITYLQKYFMDTINPSICSTIRRTIDKFNSIKASKLFLDFVDNLIKNPKSNPNLNNNKKKI